MLKARKYLSFLLLILLNGITKAQAILILDRENNAPAERVMVYDKSQQQSLMSGPNGRVEVASFQLADTLIFQHPSYELYRETLQKIIDKGSIVQLERKVIQLSEIVVSTTHWEQERFEVPTHIMQIGPRQIQLHQPQTMADALGSSGEVFIQKSQLGGGSPMIRGFSANALLIVVDGVRMNNAIFRSGNIHNIVLIDPQIIQNAAVIMGPGTVIYGSDALGGVMDFHTRKPILTYDSSALISGSNMIRYSTAAQEITEHFRVNIGFRKWAFLSSATLNTFGDIRSGRNYAANYPDFGKRYWFVKQVSGHDSVMVNTDPSVQTPSAYKQLNVMQKVRFSPTQHLDLVYAFHLSTSTNIPRYDRLTEVSKDLPKYAEWYYGPQRWTVNHLHLTSRRTYRFWDQLRLDVARQDIRESRHERRFGSDSRYHREENVLAYTLNLDFEKKFHQPLTVYYGAEGVWNDIISAGQKEDIRTLGRAAASSRYPNGKNRYYSAAAYAQSNYILSKRFISQAGLRYSYTTLHAAIADNSFFLLPFDTISMANGALTGGLGMVYHLNNKWQLNATLGSGFRAPNLDDACKVFDSEPGFIIVPNKDLGPEYAYNMEVGFIFRHRDKLRLEGQAYYTWVKDIMVRSDFSIDGRDSLLYGGVMSRIQALVNESAARIFGASLSLFCRFDNGISLQQQINMANGWEHPERIPLRHIPPVFGKTEITWSNEGLTISLYADYQGWKYLDDFAPSERNKPHIYTPDGSPAWWTLNLKVNSMITRELMLGVGLENLFDKHYRPYSSGISASGRNFIISLTGNLSNK